MISYNVKDGVDLHILREEKFRTAVFSFYIYTPITEEDITKTALLSSVLKQGSASYPTSAHISKYLEKLYGAEFVCDVRKKGDAVVCYFSVEFVNGKVIEESLEHKIINFMYEVIYNPLVDNGSFAAEYVEREKDNLKKFIECLINDKTQYAHVKCLESMFQGQPYGLYEYGNVERLKDINGKNLYEYYRSLLASAKIDIFMSGNFDEEQAIAYAKKILGAPLQNRNAKYLVPQVKAKSALKKVREKMEVNQSKLCIGLTCEVEPLCQQYYHIMVCNSIFGGNPSSKLFNNVREKLSLAYYVSSRLDRFKSIITIDCGIEGQKFKQAYDEIVLQLEQLKNGKIEDWELTAATRYLKTSLNSICDNLFVFEDYNLSQLIMGDNRSLDTFIRGVLQTSKADVTEVARKIEVDTIYCLTNEEVM